MKRATLKRASYREAVAWIANNDEAGDLEALIIEAVQDLVTVHLVADIFGRSNHYVANDVIRYRIKQQKEKNLDIT